MFGAFRTIRADERRDTWAAFFLLFGLIGSHAVLETARDALFLSKLPAERLPWVYLTMAAATLVITQVQARVARGWNRRRALSVWTVTAAAVTFGFWVMRDALGSAGLYGLYVWAGVVTTLVLVHFWTLLGDLFSVTQAKRLYGVIGTGSVLGAILGSAVASGLASMVNAQHLLVVAALGFLVTSIVPRFLQDAEPVASDLVSGSDEETSRPRSDEGMWSAAKFVAKEVYPRRVALIVVVSTAALTVADYIFKKTVAQEVPAENLGQFFGAVYLVLNGLSLVSQLGLVSFILRKFDLTIAMAVLPFLLLGGGMAAVITASLGAALLIKASDGTLKHSLHRTSTELLFVPLSEDARARIKAFVDVVGQRGGQTMASLGILIATGLGFGMIVAEVALVVLAGLWLVCALNLRRHYLELFRSRLGRGQNFTVEFPDLDVASLETLMAALDSEDDNEVIAALKVLEREDKIRVVPGLILYHPSDEVVVQALGLFTRGRRTSVAKALGRLLDHPSPRVRAAAYATQSILAPNERMLRLRLSMEESPEVRAIIMVNLIASGAITGSDAKDALDNIVEHGAVETRIALSEAVARRGAATSLTDAVIRLVDADEREVQQAAVEAMAAAVTPAFLPVLIRCLGKEPIRKRVQNALVAYGEEGRASLQAALEDTSLRSEIRFEIPQTLCLFGEPQSAVYTLLARLPHEREGLVRYRIIQALEGLLRRDPMLTLDHAYLDEAIESHVSLAYRYLDRKQILERGAEENPDRKTPGHALLVRFMRDREIVIVDRLFRLLALRYPSDDFRQIHKGVLSQKPGARAGALELIENLLKPPLRPAVVGLVDDLPDAERFQMGTHFHRRLNFDYEALLESLLSSQSQDAQDIAVYHIGELELTQFLPQVEGLELSGLSQADVDVCLERLRAVKTNEASHAAG